MTSMRISRVNDPWFDSFRETLVAEKPLLRLPLPLAPSVAGAKRR